MIQLCHALSLRFRNFIFWIKCQKGSPAQRARGLAAGVFSGCFPFFGVQTPIGIALAMLLKGNPVLAALGTWISNPLTYIPIYWLNYKIGCLLLDAEVNMNKETLINQELLLNTGWNITRRLLLGSTIVAIAASLSSGIIVYCILQSLTKE